MYTFVYDATGKPVGFIRGAFIHDMNGTAVGQIRESHVHHMNGSYVGELYQQMVVDKHLGQLRNIGTPAEPGNPGHPGNPGNRGVLRVGYTDVFERLLAR
jgi:hypothetical protein